jgi:hypothetical protein
VAPEVNDLAWSNRKVLTRVVRFLADQGGIRQFLDCGSGLPTAENTHQIARRIHPSTRVVYVDNDPAVLAHGAALLSNDDLSHITAADIFQPEQVLGDETVRSHLDFSKPLALLQVGTLHHYVANDGAELMRHYVDALASGSFVVVAHFLRSGDRRTQPAGASHGGGVSAQSDALRRVSHTHPDHRIPPLTRYRSPWPRPSRRTRDL